MGHKTIQMVLRYAEVSTETLKSQMGRFEAALEKARAEAIKADEAEEQETA